MTEPVVLHHGRQGGRCRLRRGTAVCFNSLLGGAHSGSCARPSFSARAVAWRRPDVRLGFQWLAKTGCDRRDEFVVFRKVVGLPRDARWQRTELVAVDVTATKLWLAAAG